MLGRGTNNMIEYRIFMLYPLVDYYNDHDLRLNMLADELNIDRKAIRHFEPSYAKIEYGSFAYRNIKMVAEKYGYNAVENTYGIKYSKTEMSKANLFEMKLAIYGKEDYTESYQTKFSDFYCEKCGVHQYIPMEDIYINKAEFRGKDIATSMKCNNEIIVSDKMKILIEESVLTGVEFYPAYHYNNKIKNDFPAWHMRVKSIMPPIDKSMTVNILEGYCSLCKIHHIIPLSYVRYQLNEIKSASDFNLSVEKFGPGWYGSPKLIISKKVYDLIRDNKIKGCRFEIVGVV